jgi:hypothetical protein
MSTQSNNAPRRAQIDPQNIPDMLHPLIPYAEKWSIENYTELVNTINETPIEELKELIKAVSEFATEDFDKWLLAGADNPTPTNEWASFVLLIDACDVVKIRMEQHRLPSQKNKKTAN